MSKKIKLIIVGLIVIDLLLMIFGYLHNTNIAILNPKGPIAMKERNLLLFGLALSLVVVVPVFIMTFTIAWKYRESNTKAKYSPDWDHSRLAETTWWAIPSILIFILSIVAWNSSHALDPFKPIASNVKPLTVQVIALDWKWLFIYPNQKIASVNFLEIPVNTPINLQITSDAPMNSFWVPQLAGQIYAMPGMSTQLHLVASQCGEFNGSSANLSGAGFAGMDFIAQATTVSTFNTWVNLASKSPLVLNQSTYNQLSKPSEYNPTALYSLASPSLYNNDVMKYMSPTSQLSGMDMGLN